MIGKVMSVILPPSGVTVAISSVCVYCGSSNTVAEKYKKMAHEMGTQLAGRGMRLVYGGGRVGLMGITADSTLKAGGKVIGIIPEHIRKQEVQHLGLTELHVVPDMHTRKRMMAERADAFVILPGGVGTLDETFEIITWKKLGLHNKPIILLNFEGYWDPFLALYDRIIETNFSLPSDRALFKTVNSIDGIFEALAAHTHPIAATMSGRM
jgi:uncharacterized protein (TIGR00730 family)